MIPALLFLLAATCSAQDLDAAARDLARRIGRLDVASLTVRNSSSLSPAEAADVTRLLEAELHPRAARPGAAVSVTLSENVQSYLWIAEIRRGDERELAMLPVPRQTTPGAVLAPIVIEKKLLWEQSKPILDAAVVDSTLIVLDPTAVSFYRDRQLTQSLPIPGWRPMLRDARGRLQIERDQFRAFLPGVVCSGSLKQPAAMSCGESAGPWPLDGGPAELAPGKNYFTAPRLGAFYSSAATAKFQLAAGLDGRARVYDTQREVSVVSGWGSDIAAIESSCRNGNQILATRPGEAGDPDAVQVFEVTERRAEPAGDPATFPGPITALWPSGRKGEAIAVARNPETRKYAAYSLAITCDR